MTHDKVSSIAAARERLESLKRELDEFVGDWSGCVRIRSGVRYDLDDLHRLLTFAVSDLLLAMTASDALAKPERVAVLRHRDGWHVYSDGSDDEPGSPETLGRWTIAPCKVGDKRWYIGQSKIDKTGPYAALIDWPPRHADELVAEVARTPEPTAPAPEPEVPAEVRPWLDALREVWPEMRAKFDGRAWYDVQLGYGQNVHCYVKCEGNDSFVSSILDEGRTLHHSTPAALVAALKKALGEPEPTRPALWEWVRAAEGSALGQAYVCRHQQPTESELQMWIDADGALGGEPNASVDDVPDVFITIDRHEARVYVARDEGGCNAFCRTPAEMTAALNALAEEVGHG